MTVEIDWGAPERKNAFSFVAPPVGTVCVCCGLGRLGLAEENRAAMVRYSSHKHACTHRVRAGR